MAVDKERASVDGAVALTCVCCLVNVPANQIIRLLNNAVDKNNQILATARHVRQQRYADDAALLLECLH